MGALILLLVLVISFFDWNLARGPIARMITAKTGRPASIAGNLRVHMWSWTPTYPDFNPAELLSPPMLAHYQDVTTRGCWYYGYATYAHVDSMNLVQPNWADSKPVTDWQQATCWRKKSD